MAQMPTIAVNRLTRQVTMNVTVVTTRQFKWRIALGKELIKLAARVMGCGIRIEDATGTNEAQ